MRLIGVIVADEVLVEDWTPGRRLWLKTPGRYSMDVAVEILQWVESFDGVSIPDAGWTPPGCGSLVEKGVKVRFGTIQFSIMCSYDDLFINRLAGDDRKFTILGEAIQQTFARS
ncbi:hypothetical protein [Paludisphaera mucosa]|uniref:Uncharacterized protein n=1 Tax=Paludisphaera mucosa TaxID=3030827 RepID=A0ABT6FKW8_9BACT|nr:hypothetical protein [Paludisphaera mucosa]MDG3008209.1 hypothetical protein [Paludisphaera mucosa]